MNDTLIFDKYKILKVVSSDNGINCYIAEMLYNDANKCVMVNEISNRDLIDKYIVQITIMTNAGNSDFIEYFTFNSKFYTVFHHNAGTTLKRTLYNNATPFLFRLGLLNKILLTMVEHGYYPNIVKANILNVSNIVYEENELAINYKFLITSGDIESEQIIYTQLKNTIDELFSSNEISKNVKLKIISEKCDKGLYHSFGEVLKDLEELSVQIDHDKDLKGIILEKKNRWKDTFKKIALAVLLIATFLYGYDYFMEKSNSYNVYNDLGDIGNVPISGVSSTKDEDIAVYINSTITETVKPENLEIKDLDTEQLEELPQQNNDETINLDNVLDSKDYNVLSGDNLTLIVTREYGDTSLLDEVIRINNVTNPHLIYPDQKIKLPIIKEN